MYERSLRWDGCADVRDLGGHATEDGRRTRFRAVVHADSRGMLTAAGWKALEAYGVFRVVDLPRDDELARAERLAAAETPGGALAELLTRLEHDPRTVDGYLEAAGLGADDQARLRARLLG